MNEPVTNSATQTAFTGKTSNSHPQWQNQPLRLTKEQINDPLPIIAEFFDCYHLQDVRSILWDWVTEIVSSDRSISNDPNDRKNHLYFYEKLEELVEVAFVITKRRETDKPPHPVNSKELPEPTDNLDKERQLIEYVEENPFYVLNEIFDPTHYAFINDELDDWLLISLISGDTVYDDEASRQNLATFCGDLRLLTEALFKIHYENKADVDKLKSLPDYNFHLLKKEQNDNPQIVLVEFFEKYSTVYISRELNDWLHVGISHLGDWRDKMTCPLQVLETYRKVLCLTKSAKRLLTHQK